ncbi:MAG TPA: nucleotide exchange factor GrpE [Opitutaceae bacterium]|nr:nucleotide exchange factor GrpE [Opitutaceae bacterium]
MTASKPQDTLARPDQGSAAAAPGPPGTAGSAHPPAKAPAVASGAPSAAEAAPPSVEEQLAVAKQEAAGNYDRYLRAVADLENFRRRALREKDELRQFAAVNLLQHLLPVLDNLQLGLAAARQEADAKSVSDGVAMVLEQFKGVLGRSGLKALDPMGQKFDPHVHEALSHQPSAEVPEEHVLRVVRSGYTFHGRLLRPASVIVSSGPAKEAKG